MRLLTLILTLALALVPVTARADGEAEARWVGACKAGQRAGDVVTADGMKMNLLDMVKAGPAMRGKGTAR